MENMINKETERISMMSTDKYVSPLSERYASEQMQYIFSPDMKFRTWRRLWIALAETEMELGLCQNGQPVITQEQIDELKAHAEDINYDVAKAREKEVRHDVMSHVYAYGQQCPKAAGIIHLGATSCYVGDNTDIIVMTQALKLVKKKLVNVIAELAKFADTYKDLPTLAFTHFQPAQPTTVGKRATLWAQELDKIDPMIAKKMGFEKCYPVSGQTYSRKVDTRVCNVLAGIAASAHKMSNDIRLLQHLKEVEEPFEKSQILDLCLNVVDGLVVYDKVITKRLMSELPFMATENIMMDAVKMGGNRQELHEKIRELSMIAGARVKQEGKENNLLELIAEDPSFNMSAEDLEKTMDPSRYVGRAPLQVKKFLEEIVDPILKENKDLLGIKAQINV